jgi:hypothetical protein
MAGSLGWHRTGSHAIVFILVHQRCCASSCCCTSADLNMRKDMSLDDVDAEAGLNADKYSLAL